MRFLWLSYLIICQFLVHCSSDDPFHHDDVDEHHDDEHQDDHHDDEPLCDCHLHGIDPATHTTCKSATPLSTPEPFDKVQVLQRHKEYRSLVVPLASNMQEMTWDDDLACMAQKWTQQCSPGVDAHATLPGVYPTVGQNVVAGPMGAFDIMLACNYWHAPGENYTYASPIIPQGNVLFYTQLIWAKTSHIGCGATRCPNVEKTFYACFYGPPGNAWNETAKPYRTA